MATYKRPAFEKHVTLGTLYNAHTDSFSPVPLLGGEIPESAILQTVDATAKQVDQAVLEGNTYEEKFRVLGVPPELAASILAGFLEPGGSGTHIRSPYRPRSLERAFRQRLTNVHQKLDFTNQAVQTSLVALVQELSAATHIVAEVTWGAECIVSVSGKSTLQNKSDDLGALIDECSNSLEEAGRSVTARTQRSPSKIFDDSLVITLSSGLLGDRNPFKTTFDNALKFLEHMTGYISSLNDGKGQPLMYTLLPVSLLGFFLPVQITSAVLIQQPSLDTLGDVVRVFDRFTIKLVRLDEREAYLKARTSFVSRSRIKALSDEVEALRTAFSEFRTRYSQLLPDVRTGIGSVQEMSALVSGAMSSQTDLGPMSGSGRSIYDILSFIDEAVALGAHYIGYNGLTFNERSLRRHRDAYVFCFNEITSQDDQAWEGNTKLLLDTLRTSGNKVFVLLVDYDGFHGQLQTQFVSHYQEGHVIVKNVLERQHVLSQHSIVRYDPSKLHPNDKAGKAVRRRPLKIPCSGVTCDSTIRREWFCLHCQSLVEYSPDGRFSCDCGQWFFHQSSFKCESPAYGPDFIKYPKNKLHQLLENLEPYEQINILILGETGVGKSTFINAFINYLNFESLDAALEVEKLHYIIPFSFSTQIVDDSDTMGRIHQQKISYGADKDERDGSKGESSTQKTQVYPVTFGSKVVRLIDTPGIGDTRGMEQDEKNMADIISVLRGYENIHGILVLLKPNNPKLTVTFRFCIKELLTHLHRSAADNMVFGFTNTRGSSYQPGDTFKPLQHLLGQFDSVNIGLFKHTVYCFDSESFRYLAARQKGIIIGDQADYDRSWEQSRNEARRLLSHFQSLKPHRVKG